MPHKNISTKAFRVQLVTHLLNSTVLKADLLLNPNQASLFPPHTIHLGCRPLNLFANSAAHCSHINCVSFGLCVYYSTKVSPNSGVIPSWPRLGCCHLIPGTATYTNRNARVQGRISDSVEYCRMPKSS